MKPDLADVRAMLLDALQEANLRRDEQSVDADKLARTVLRWFNRPRCCFCGSPDRHLFHGFGDDVTICDTCVTLCADALK